MKRAAAVAEHAALEAAPERGTTEEYQAYFARLSRAVLHERLLQVGAKQFRVVECEVYVRAAAGWNDMFAHADPQQLIPGSFYFHKTGNGFRGGSYKGMDIGCGQPDAYGGVLVRSVVDLETGTMTSGPSLCVDLFLKTLSVDSIATLVERYGWCGENPEFRVIPNPEPLRDEIRSSFRVGLSLKAKQFSDSVLSYWIAPLRFFTREIPKNRQLHVLQLLFEGGRADDEIVRITGASHKSLGVWKSDFAAGLKHANAAKYFGTKFSSGDISGCVGAYRAMKDAAAKKN